MHTYYQHADSNYYTSPLTVCLDNGTIVAPIINDNCSINIPNGVAVTEQKNEQPPAENSLPEALQQKSDTVVDVKEDELCDLSVYNSV